MEGVSKPNFTWFSVPEDVAVQTVKILKILLDCAFYATVGISIDFCHDRPSEEMS